MKVKGGVNPPRGFGSDEDHASSGSLNLGRRREHAAWRQAHPGHRFWLGVRSKQPTAKSLTTTGPISRKAKGLPVIVRDVPNREEPLPMGTGGASGFCPRKSWTMIHANDARMGMRRIRQLARGLTTSSDVTDYNEDYH